MGGLAKRLYRNGKSGKIVIRLYANSGAAQILFFQGEQPEISYAERKGKYQNQVGIQLAKAK